MGKSSQRLVNIAHLKTICWTSFLTETGEIEHNKNRRRLHKFQLEGEIFLGIYP